MDIYALVLEENRVIYVRKGVKVSDDRFKFRQVECEAIELYSVYPSLVYKTIIETAGVRWETTTGIPAQPCHICYTPEMRDFVAYYCKNEPRVIHIERVVDDLEIITSVMSCSACGHDHLEIRFATSDTRHPYNWIGACPCTGTEIHMTIKTSLIGLG